MVFPTRVFAKHRCWRTRCDDQLIGSLSTVRVLEEFLLPLINISKFGIEPPQPPIPRQFESDIAGFLLSFKSGYHELCGRKWVVRDFFVGLNRLAKLAAIPVKQVVIVVVPGNAVKWSGRQRFVRCAIVECPLK